MQRISRAQASLYERDGRRKYLTPNERARLIAAALRCIRPEVGTLALCLAYTGCRISEALALRAGSFDPAEAFVAIHCLKKRSRFVMREVPLPRSLIERLRGVHNIDTVDADRRLWTWSRGRAWFLIKQVMLAAGIAAGPHRTAKGLRHGFAIHALRCGVPINLVRRWLGHASLATTEIYLEALGDEEREFASRMWTDDPLLPVDPAP